jgi:hypothetical protein
VSGEQSGRAEGEVDPVDVALSESAHELAPIALAWWRGERAPILYEPTTQPGLLSGERMPMLTKYRGIKYRIWRRLYLWLCAFYDDYHDITFTGPDGTRINFFCYGDFTGSWPDGWEFECSCEDAAA